MPRVAGDKPHVERQHVAAPRKTRSGRRYVSPPSARACCERLRARPHDHGPIPKPRPYPATTAADPPVAKDPRGSRCESAPPRPAARRPPASYVTCCGSSVAPRRASAPRSARPRHTRARRRACSTGRDPATRARLDVDMRIDAPLTDQPQGPVVAPAAARGSASAHGSARAPLNHRSRSANASTSSTWSLNISTSWPASRAKHGKRAQRIEPVIEDRDLHRHEYLYLRQDRECRLSRPASSPAYAASRVEAIVLLLDASDPSASCQGLIRSPLQRRRWQQPRWPGTRRAHYCGPSAIRKIGRRQREGDV